MTKSLTKAKENEMIDKQTKLFLRDDFTWDSETEIGLSVEPSQGLIKPK